MFKNAKVGDRIWTPFGIDVKEGETNGEIIDIIMKTEDCNYRVLIVTSINGIIKSFNQDGKNFNTDSFPTLFWCKPKIEIPSKPVVKHTYTAIVKSPLEIIGIDCEYFSINVGHNGRVAVCYSYYEYMKSLAGKKIVVKKSEGFYDYVSVYDCIQWLEDWLKDITVLKEM